MSFTRRNESGKAYRDALRSVVLAGVAFLSGGGCVSPGTVHPDFERLQPRTVCVPPVENATIHQLDQVAFGGLLQKSLIGGRTLNILDIIRGAAQEAVVLKGYVLVDCPSAVLALRDSSSPPDHDAVCRITVLEWSVDPVASQSLQLLYQIELRDVESGQLLYTARYGCGYGAADREPREDEIPYMIRRSVKAALGDLPAAAETEP